jgi:hypothetical protein
MKKKDRERKQAEAYLVALHSDDLENPGEFSALSWEGMLKCVPFNFIRKPRKDKVN